MLAQEEKTNICDPATVEQYMIPVLLAFHMEVCPGGFLSYVYLPGILRDSFIYAH